MAVFYQYSPSPNRGEQLVENYLKKLSDNATVFAEYRLYNQGNTLAKEKKPDFIVLSRQIGLICLEVKDWNISRNSYRWKNQYTIIKTDFETGKQTEISNPFSQASDYKYLLLNLVKQEQIKIPVNSFVVFPTIERASFINKFSDLDFFHNQQANFNFDINSAIFKDDLENNINGLDAYFVKRCSQQNELNTISPDALQKLENYLILPEFIVGGESQTKRKHRNKLSKLTNLQQKWAFSIKDSNALILDIAGSGKTTALISRAIYLATTEPYKKILMTTYNEKLTENLKEMYHTRFNKASLKTKQLISIVSIQDIAKQVLTQVYGENSTNLSEIDIIDEAAMAVEDDLGRFQVFDYVLIDEVQDFTTSDLQFLSLLCKSQNGFFFTGDIGQKIYNKHFNLKAIDIDANNISLPKEYKMYRTPSRIASLALQFIMQNQVLKDEFSNFGYLSSAANCTDKVGMVAEFHASKPITELIQDCIVSGYNYENIILITTEDRVEGLKKIVSNEITLLTYYEVKGFEASCIILDNIENLFPTSIFSSSDELEELDILARRLIYIALTRTTEEVHIFISDSNHKYVTELMSINMEIMKGE